MIILKEPSIRVALLVFIDASCGLLISSTDSNDCSTKQDALKQAQVLGMNVRTMEDWLEKAIQQTVIERIMKGMYHKRSA